MRDVEIVSSFLFKISIILKNIIPNWPYTCYSISGLALNLFKLKFDNFKINLSLSIPLDEIIRESYYGGRCEVFGNPLLGDYIYHFDFTGMYSNRLKEAFPLGEPEKKIRPAWENKPGFYSVRVRSNLDIPILPFRCKQTNKLLFPNGEFSGVYWYEELDLFLNEGGVLVEIF
jgi:hypothetical protein